MKKTLNCHLLQSTPTETDIVPATDRFIEVKTLVDESHIIRRILKCKECEQLYLYEFYEEIDWAEGNDPQYRTFVPVETVEKAEIMNKIYKPGFITALPRLQFDFLQNGTKTIAWFR